MVVVDSQTTCGFGNEGDPNEVFRTVICDDRRISLVRTPNNEGPVSSIWTTRGD